MRLDRFLWQARIVKKREWAQAMATSGRLRLSGRVVEKAAAAVHVGDVLSFAMPGPDGGGRVRAIRVVALPGRRGPAEEARGCYEELLQVGVGSGTTVGENKNVSQQEGID